MTPVLRTCTSYTTQLPMSCFNGGTGWPERVVRVQAVSETCGATLPDRYVKPPADRPSLPEPRPGPRGGLNIPVIDLSMPESEETVEAVSAASREWGFFQAVNHGVDPELMRRARAAWRGFFRQPAEVRERYANSPATYEGYGSRLGTAKGALLDWGDYYFLHLLPRALKSHEKWPSVPPTLRPTTEEYSEEVVKLCRRVMRAAALGLGLEAGRLLEAFGGEGVEGVCLRVNFYPRCPQPELTLGVSAHSDPGGVTMLLVDDHVRGLQVRHGGEWITVDPVPDAFIVNIGDQIQVLSNATYKSIDHRVTVSAAEDRLSLAFFYNPRGDMPIAPMPELVAPPHRPALYPPITFDQYRRDIRERGPRGKAQLQSRKTILN